MSFKYKYPELAKDNTVSKGNLLIMLFSTEPTRCISFPYAFAAITYIKTFILHYTVPCMCVSDCISRLHRRKVDAWSCLVRFFLLSSLQAFACKRLDYSLSVPLQNRVFVRLFKGKSPAQLSTESWNKL